MSTSSYYGLFVDRNGVQHALCIDYPKREKGAVHRFVSLGVPPVRLSYESEDILSPIVEGRCRFSIYSEDDQQFVHLCRSREGEVRVSLFKLGTPREWTLDELQHLSGASGVQLLWRGVLDPESYSEPYTSRGGYMVELEACDLGVLKRKKFVTPKESRLELRQLISKLSSPAGVDVAFSGSQWITEAVSRDGDAQFRVAPADLYVPSALFNHSGKEDAEDKTCYELLEGVLRSLSLRIEQRMGRLLVYDLNSLSSTDDSERRVLLTSAPQRLRPMGDDAEVMGTRVYDQLLLSVDQGLGSVCASYRSALEGSLDGRTLMSVPRLDTLGGYDLMGYKYVREGNEAISRKVTIGEDAAMLVVSWIPEASHGVGLVYSGTRHQWVLAPMLYHSASSRPVFVDEGNIIQLPNGHVRTTRFLDRAMEEDKKELSVPFGTEERDGALIALRPALAGVHVYSSRANATEVYKSLKEQCRRLNPKVGDSLYRLTSVNLNIPHVTVDVQKSSCLRLSAMMLLSLSPSIFQPLDQSNIVVLRGDKRATSKDEDDTYFGDLNAKMLDYLNSLGKRYPQIRIPFDLVAYDETGKSWRLKLGRDPKAKVIDYDRPNRAEWAYLDEAFYGLWWEPATYDVETRYREDLPFLQWGYNTKEWDNSIQSERILSFSSSWQKANERLLGRPFSVSHPDLGEGMIIPMPPVGATRLSLTIFSNGSFFRGGRPVELPIWDVPNYILIKDISLSLSDTDAAEGGEARERRLLYTYHEEGQERLEHKLLLSDGFGMHPASPAILRTENGRSLYDFYAESRPSFHERYDGRHAYVGVGTLPDFLALICGYNYGSQATRPMELRGTFAASDDVGIKEYVGRQYIRISEEVDVQDGSSKMVLHELRPQLGGAVFVPQVLERGNSARPILPNVDWSRYGKLIDSEEAKRLAAEEAEAKALDAKRHAEEEAKARAKETKEEAERRIKELSEQEGERYRNAMVMWGNERDKASAALKTYTDEKTEEAKRYARTWNKHSHTFDLSALDSSKYYACIVWLSGTPYKNPNSARIRVYCGLGAAKAAPTYATNATGFGLQLEWTVNGEGWGGRSAERVITGYQTRFVKQGEEVCSVPKQREEISAEYVYLRGGYVYTMDVWTEQEPRGFFLAETDWAAKGYESRKVLSPVTSVTPPKAIYRELRDSIDEGDKDALKGAKNYYDKEREKIDAKIDANTRELAGRIASSDAKLLEAQQAMQGRYVSLLEAQQAMQAELQRQIDKQVESHYGEQPPSGRYGWTATEDAKHEGDTYTCRAPEGVTITPENAAKFPNVGKSWRFSRGGWVELADTDLTRALALAGQAKAAADGKVTHYRGDAIPMGYREGDLWTLTAAWNGFRKGSILTAVKDEVVGQYNPNHWREELRYTDDSAVRDLQLGGRNYAKGTAGVKEGSGYMVSESRVGAPWVAGVDYTISFILGSEHNDMLVYLYVDGWSASDCAVRAEGTPTQGADGLYYARYSATFRTTEERIALSVKRIAGGNGGFRLYKTRRLGGSDQGRYSLSRVMLERGNKASDWSPAPEDTDEAISKEGQEGRKYTEGKTKEAKDYADTKTKEAKDEAAKKAKEQDGKLKTLEEARAEQAKALQQLGVRLEGQGEELKAAQRGLESYRYLTEVLGKGDTLISGGLVLSNIIAARDSTGGVRSWVSGLIKDEHGRNYPAFAAGVTGYGTASERRIVELNHDGSGHFGLMYIDDNGRVLRFRPEGSKAGEVLRIGGEQPSLEQLLAQRPFSANLRHSGGFDRRNLAETLGAELWRSSEKFHAPMGAHLSYRMSVRGLRCFIAGGDPAVYPYIRPEEWDTDVELTFSVWRSGDPFDPVVEITRDVGANASMGEREQSVEDVHLELDLPATDTYYTKVAATRKQLYRITASSKEQVDKAPSGMEVVLELTVQECTGTVRKDSEVEQETVISTRGISVVGSAQRLFAVDSSTGSSSPVLAVRGRTDMPGILAAAEIKVHPRLEIANRWGMHATRLKVERIGGGRYRVTHLLNRLDYIVQLTPYANGYGGMVVENKRASSFEVVTYDRTSGTDGTPFALTIIGDNA